MPEQVNQPEQCRQQQRRRKNRKHNVIVQRWEPKKGEDLNNAAPQIPLEGATNEESSKEQIGEKDAQENAKSIMLSTQDSLNDERAKRTQRKGKQVKREQIDTSSGGRSQFQSL